MPTVGTSYDYSAPIGQPSSESTISYTAVLKYYRRKSSHRRQILRDESLCTIRARCQRLNKGRFNQ